MNGINKRIIVIKNIPSNIIEEAILILKNGYDTGDAAEISPGKKPQRINKKNDNRLLVKEAETVINNYIRENRIRGCMYDKAAVRPGFQINKTLINVIINTFLAGSVILLIFVIIKMF